MKTPLTNNLDHLSFLLENDMPTPEWTENLSETRSYIMNIAIKGHVARGMTPEAVKDLVEKALDAPWNMSLPTFEDL